MGDNLPQATEQVGTCTYTLVVRTSTSSQRGGCTVRVLLEACSGPDLRVIDVYLTDLADEMFGLQYGNFILWSPITD